MGCLHDPANVQQASSKCNAGRLLDRVNTPLLSDHRTLTCVAAYHIELCPVLENYVMANIKNQSNLAADRIAPFICQVEVEILQLFVLIRGSTFKFPFSWGSETVAYLGFGKGGTMASARSASL